MAEKNTVLSVRVRPAERELLERAAEVEGVGLSTFMRRAAIIAAGESVEDALRAERARLRKLASPRRRSRVGA